MVYVRRKAARRSTFSKGRRSGRSKFMSRRRSYRTGIRRRFRKGKKASSPPAFARKVKNALTKIGAKNWFSFLDNADLMPYLGIRGLTTAQATLNGKAGCWYNQSGAQGGVSVFEITQFLAYDPAPGYNIRENTRQSNRIRITKIVIRGHWSRLDQVFDDTNRGNIYLDLAPYIAIPTKGADPNFADYTQASILPAQFFADRLQTPISASHASLGDGYHALLEGLVLRDGKHDYVIKRQPYRRFSIGAQGEAISYPTPPANMGAATSVETYSNYNMPGFNGQDYVAWTIPVNMVVDYPQSAQEDPNGIASAKTPIFLGWAYKPSGDMLANQASLGASNFNMGTWRHFHVYVFFEDIFGFNY